MEIKFSSMRSKVLRLGVSEATKWLAAQSTAYVLCHRLGKHKFVIKKNLFKRNLQYPGDIRMNSFPD